MTFSPSFWRNQDGGFFVPRYPARFTPAYRALFSMSSGQWARSSRHIPDIVTLK